MSENGNSGGKKKGMGFFPKFLIFIIILIVAAVVAAKILFPAEKVRAEIVSRASKALGRTVELDGVSFSLIPGPRLDLRGLRIFNPENFPGGELVSIDRLACDLKIMPLLRKQFVFSEIKVEHPVINLRKTADGKTNYTFDIAPKEMGVETPSDMPEKVSSSEAAMSVFAFDWAEITAGDLIYIDDSAEVSTAIHDLTMKTSLELDPTGKKGKTTGTLKTPAITATNLPNKLPLAVELSYNADIDFEPGDIVFSNTTLTINGLAFTLEGTIRKIKGPQSIFAKIKAAGISLEPLVAYMPSTPQFDPKLLRLSGTLDGEVESRIEMGTGLAPYFGGWLAFNDLTAGYQTVAARVHCDQLKVQFTADTITLATEGGKVAEESFSLAGTVSNWSDLAYDITTRGAVNLTAVTPFLDTAAHHDLSGTLKFDLQTVGRKSRWAESSILGRISVDQLHYSSKQLTKPLERFDLILTFAPYEVAVDSLYAEYPGVRMSLKGRLNNGIAHLLQPRKDHKRPALDFALYAPKIDYDILFPEEERAKGAAGELPDSLPPIYIPDIEAKGSAVIDTLIYSKVEFTNITGNVAYQDKIVIFKNTKGNLYSGNVAGDGSVDITDLFQPLVKTEFNATGVEANDFLERFANLGGHLYGKFNMNGSLTGRGSEVEDFVQSLSADGNVDMKEGRLVNFDLINQVAGKFGFKTFKEESLRDLASAIKVRDGRILFEGTKLISQVGDWDVGGGVGFLDKTLDLNLGVYLTPEMAGQFNMLGSLLKDDKGRMKVNFTVGGSYTNPTISNISTGKSAVKEKAQEAVKKKTEDLLKGLIKKP